MRVAVLFDNFGPYHLARLKAAARVCELTAVQVCSQSAEYAWKIEARADDFKIVTLFAHGKRPPASHRELAHKLETTLSAAQPDVVFVPGWSSLAAFAALRWCAGNKTPAVAMSESTEWDEKRTMWKETVKHKLVGLCSAALAGGTPHRDYMIKLGIPAGRIFFGYDTVDNDYFADKAEEVRSQKSEVGGKHGLPEKYFLASSRFIDMKNLPRLMEAYALYRKKAEMLKTEIQKAEGTSPRPSPQGGEREALWDLVLLGDGELRETLNSQLSTLNLRGHVQMPGFIQYPDLPVYYGLAGAFIHASTKEPWGLVVNEAMASGLPVLVSNRCGCAVDLAQEGVNGFTFDPYNVEEIAQLMLKISDFRFPISDFGAASARIIAHWGPERFASGLRAAVEKAMEVGPVKAAFFERNLLKLLISRQARSK